MAGVAVFFPARGKQREFAWQGDRWQPIPLGYHAVQVVNQVVNLVLSENVAALQELTGCGTEEEAISRVWPLLAFTWATRPEVGFTAEVLEKVPPTLKGVSVDWVNWLRYYLTGQDGDFRQLWSSLLWYPCLGPQNRFGWLAAGTVVEVGLAEAVWAFANKLKPFKLCNLCRKAYVEDRCPSCWPGQLQKKRYLTLLRRHKGRLQKEKKFRETAWGVAQINALQKKLQGKKKLVTHEIIKDHLVVCLVCGLPTRWLKEYVTDTKQRHRLLGEATNIAGIKQT